MPRFVDTLEFESTLRISLSTILRSFFCLSQKRGLFEQGTGRRYEEEARALETDRWEFAYGYKLYTLGQVVTVSEVSAFSPVNGIVCTVDLRGDAWYRAWRWALTAAAVVVTTS